MPLETKEYAVNESSFELLPAGVYQCRLTDLAEKIVVNKQTNEARDCIEWSFEVLAGPHKGKEITDLCAAPVNGLGPKTKMRQWIEGFTGQSLQGRTKPVDPNRLIGKDCLLTLSRGPNQAGREVNKIVALSPANGAAPAPEPPKAAPAGNGDGDLF